MSTAGATGDAADSAPAERDWRSPREAPLARVVFALVVLATFAAFGVTQWLKHTPTPVQQLEISPAALTVGAAGETGVEQIAFHLQRSDYVTVGVIDSQGDTVRTVVRRLWLRAYKRAVLYWKGMQAGHRLAPPGTYRVSFYLERQKKEVLSPVTFEVARAKGGR